jgi:hypothetical protein
MRAHEHISCVAKHTRILGSHPKCPVRQFNCVAAVPLGVVSPVVDMQVFDGTAPQALKQGRNADRALFPFPANPARQQRSPPYPRGKEMRYRAQFELHLQGSRSGCETSRARACCALSARGLRPKTRRSRKAAVEISCRLRRPGVTLILPWQEYCTQNPKAYIPRWIGKEAVPGVLHDPATVLADFWVDQVPEVVLKPLTGPLLIRSRQARVPRHIGSEYSREATDRGHGR